MNLPELKIDAVLREGTRTFVTQHSAQLDKSLEVVNKAHEGRMRRLKGAEGLLLKRNYLQADSLWQKYFWIQLSNYLLDENLALLEATEKAEQDLLLLSHTLGPL